MLTAQHYKDRQNSPQSYKEECRKTDTGHKYKSSNRFVKFIIIALLFILIHFFTTYSSPWNLRISVGVKRKKMVVLLDQNFMARVPENVIQHSRELKIHKKIAEQQGTISLLGKALDLLLDQ